MYAFAIGIIIVGVNTFCRKKVSRDMNSDVLLVY